MLVLGREKTADSEGGIRRNKRDGGLGAARGGYGRGGGRGGGGIVVMNSVTSHFEKKRTLTRANKGQDVRVETTQQAVYNEISRRRT